MLDNLTTEGETAAGAMVGGGAAGALMRSLNWARTPVGPLAAWPQSLRTAVSICLSARIPMIIFWGPELVQFYNDAYRPILGTKHPAAMGQGARECWPEIWDVIGPLLQDVLQTGEATWSDDQLLLLDRSGFLEDAYFSFFYSAIRDETGGVAGVFCTVTETTGRVVGERRLRTLRDLAARMTGAKTAADAGERAVNALACNPRDLPFVILYLLDDTARHTYRVAGVAAQESPIDAPAAIALAEDNDRGIGSLADVVRGGRAVEVRDVDQALWPTRPVTGDRPARPAVLTPMSQPGQERIAGILVTGVSPRQALDDTYRDFFTLVAGQIAAGVESFVQEAVRWLPDAGPDLPLDAAWTSTHLMLAHERARAAENRARLLADERAARGEAVERAQQLEAVIDSIADPVVVYNANGIITRANAAAHDLFGTALNGGILAGSAEMHEAVAVHSSLGTQLPLAEMPARRILAGEVLSGATAVDIVSRSTVGKDRYLRVVGAPIRNLGGQVIGGVNVIHDLTERQALEMAVRLERDRLGRVVDLLPDAVLVCDSTPTCLICNAAARQILGGDMTALPIQLSGDALSPGMHHQLLRVDGTSYPVEELPLTRSLLRDQPVHAEQLIVRTQDGHETPVLASSIPLHGEHGSVTGAVLVFQDITAIKDLERARNEFMSSIAHDLKTPLTSIRGFAQLARRYLKRVDAPESPRLITIMSRIEVGTSQMMSMMDELMDVMRMRLGAAIVLDLQPVDLVQLVREVLAGLPDAQGRSLEVREEFPAIHVVIDRARMTRVIANLLSNAVKYTREGDGIQVRMSRSETWAEVVVKDQGIGISEKDLPHIFERFQRAANVPDEVSGMGIGLSSAQQIVTQHGGSITVESVLGKGSTFTVRLPLRTD